MGVVLSDILLKCTNIELCLVFMTCAILNVICAPAALEAVFIHLYLIRLLNHFLQAVAEEVFRSFK